MFLTVVPLTHPLFSRARWHDGSWAHHRVMDLFGDLGGGPTARQCGQVLFRVEPDVGEGRVLVQSSVAPVVDGLRSSSLLPMLERLEVGTRVRFLLHANAVRTVNDTNYATGKVRKYRADVHPEALPAWVANRLEGAIDVSVLDDPTRQSRMMRDARLSVSTFRGHGTVSDPQQLRQLIAEGVGRGKAYGCGLLSVLPN
jgi:CRISPR system Cascade subunit CasE